MADHVMAYLIKPVKQAHLEPAIAIALRRFQEFEALRKETASLRQALNDRKVIEQAKRVLMETAGMDEAGRLPPLAAAGQRKESQADRDRPDGADRQRGDAARPLASGTATGNSHRKGRKGTQRGRAVDENEASRHIVDAAMKVHSALGPGLLESAYQSCLEYELQERGVRVAAQVPMPLRYGRVALEVGYRVD